MNIFEAIIIAVVEGLTEFLPVSSTGHMIITQALLGMESSPFVKAFTVVIQFGAILSVVVLYWKRFFRLNDITILDRKVLAGMPAGKKGWNILKRLLYKFDFYWKLFIAVIPAGIIGLLLGDYIDTLLENVTVVAVMLVVGGVFMLYVDKWFNKPSQDQSMTWQRALKIGFFSVYCHDSRCLPLHGDHCRWYGQRAVPQECGRILFLSGSANHGCCCRI